MAGACRSAPERVRGLKLVKDLINAADGKVVAEAGTKMTPRAARQLQEKGTKEILVGADDLESRYVAVDIINEEDGGDLRRGRRSADGGDHRSPSGSRGKPRFRRSTSITSTSGPISATRCRRTRAQAAKRHSSRSTGSCGRVSRRHRKPRKLYSRACSSMPSGTTFPRSAA